jgi:hypothetical protein
VPLHTKFHKDWSRRSKVNKGDTQTHRQHGDIISILVFFFFKIKKAGQKRLAMGVFQRMEEITIRTFG